MANFGRALQELRQERSRIEREVERLDNAISVLEGVVRRTHPGGEAGRGLTARLGRPRRRMSAAGRRRIAAAQRARWANQRTTEGGGTQATKKPRRMSAAARKTIARAQRIRWAKLKAQRRAAAREPKKPVQKSQAKAA